MVVKNGKLPHYQPIRRFFNDEPINDTDPLLDFAYVVPTQSLPSSFQDSNSFTTPTGGPPIGLSFLDEIQPDQIPSRPQPTQRPATPPDSGPTLDARISDNARNVEHLTNAVSQLCLLIDKQHQSTQQQQPPAKTDSSHPTDYKRTPTPLPSTHPNFLPTHGISFAAVSRLSLYVYIISDPVVLQRANALHNMSIRLTLLTT